MYAKYKYLMCRLCLCKSGALTDIHGCKVESGYIAAALISDLLQLVVSVTDMYPQVVCLECLKKLTDFQRFKDSCWKAKVNFGTIYLNSPFPDVNSPGRMCEGGVSLGANNEIPIETVDECSNPCSEEYLEKTNVTSEIDVKDEPIEELPIRDPLSLESPYRDAEEVPKEDITIKEEEIQINQRVLVEEAPVTLLEKTGKTTLPQVNSGMGWDTQGTLYVNHPDTSSTNHLNREISSTIGVDYYPNQVNSGMGWEDTQGSLFVNQPVTSSTHLPHHHHHHYREISSTNGVDCYPNQGISKQPEENNLVKERNGLSYFNNTVNNSMFSFPLDYLVQLNLQGHIQSNNYMGMIAQNGGNNMHQMERRKEWNSSKVEEIMLREGVRNSSENGFELGRKGRENVRRDGIAAGVNKGKTTSVQYFCKECCKIFISTADLDNHSCEMFAVNNYDCRECGKKFQNEKILRYHMREHNLNVHIYCQICGKGYLREDDLSMHLSSHENNSPLEAVAASIPRFSILSGGSVSDVGQIQNNCDLEKEQVKNRKKGSKIVKACPICHRDFSCANSLQRHMLAHHSEKNFQCSLCPRKFRTEKGAQYHARKHSINRPYCCEVCGAGFYKEVCMLKHISLHAKDEPFQCDRCGKKYDHKRPLWSHIARCYKMEIYECNMCNKRFHCQAYLTQHMTIHTGEKNLMCEVCGRTFRGINTLMIHRRQHTGEKPYHCDICDKRFTQKISFVSHNKRYH